MTEAATTLSLSEHYLLDEQDPKSAVMKDEKAPIEPVKELKGDPPAPEVEDEPKTFPKETAEAAIEQITSDSTQDTTPITNEDAAENDAIPSEEPNEAASEENASEEDSPAEPEIKLETAPADFRFPTTNQTRHCFTRYVEYHRCVASKGEDASECGKFAKYYRSLCPGEWVDRWNEQRENGTFPGPL